MTRSYGEGTLYRRDGIWYLNYVKNGRRYRESSGTALQSDAEELLRKRMSGEEERTLTVRELLDHLFDILTIRQIRSLIEVKRHAKMIYENFGHLPVDKVKDSTILTFQKRMLSQGYANATINRRLAVLRQAYRLALEGGRVDEEQVPRIRMLSEHENIRTGFLSEQDVFKISECAPHHLKDFILFGFYTGWRRGQVRELRWKNVDLQKDLITVSATHTKNKEAQTLPIVGAVKNIIQRRWLERNGDYVFHWKGKKLDYHHSTIRKAFDKAGFPDNFYHDLRRSAIRRLVVAGVPQTVAMKISGHRNPNVFRRYAIIEEADVARAMLETEEYHKRVERSKVYRESSSGNISVRRRSESSHKSSQAASIRKQKGG